MRCVVQPLSLPSSLYLALYVDISSLSQEDLSYLWMSFYSCCQQSNVTILTREGGGESGMEVTTWHYSSSMATAVSSELIHVYMHNMQPTMVPSWPHTV